MSKVFLNFKPFLGDLYLMRGVARALRIERGEDSMVITHLKDEGLQEFFSNKYFDVQVIPDLPPFTIKPVNNQNVELEKRLVSDKQFMYVYNPNPLYIQRLEKVIDENIDVFENITKTYTVHYQFEIAYIGYYLEKKYGIENIGFKLEQVGDRFILPQRIWNPNGILALISNLIKVDIDQSYFSTSLFNKVKDDTILLLPASRNENLLSNQYWGLAEKLLKLKGYTVNKAVFNEDYFSFEELMDLIKRHRIIMCNDSFPYHVAWSQYKAIILLEKAGFNSEWKHEPYSTNKVYSIPSSPMYEEEFVHQLNKAIEYIEG